MNSGVNEDSSRRSALLSESRIVTMGDTEKVINVYLALLEGGTPR